MNNEFKKSKSNNETRYVLENSATVTTGSVATAPSSLGKVQKRNPDNILAQEAGKDKVDASKPRNFVAKNAKMGGAGAHKDKKKAQKQGTEKHKKPYMEALKKKIEDLKSKLNEAQGVAEAFANPGSGSTGTSRGEKRISNIVRKALAKHPETPEQQAARKDFQAQTDARMRQKKKEQGVAEGSLNELSKDTLKSYAKKAVPDMKASQDKSKSEYSKAAAAKDDKDAEKHYDAAKQAKDRTEKRMAGVAGAIKRFNKEGVAEGSTPNKGDEVYYRNRLVGWFVGYGNNDKVIVEPNEDEGHDSNNPIYIDKSAVTIKPNQQGVAEAPEDRTSYQVAKILSDRGIKYDPSQENELINAIGMVLVKELNMTPKEARNLISYDEDFVADTLGELRSMEQSVSEVDVYMESLAESLQQVLSEKAVSKQQQKFMGMVHAAQKGEKPASKEVAKVAKDMGKKDAKDFASTKHKGLPEKKKSKK